MNVKKLNNSQKSAERYTSAYLTVYLALVLTVLLSLFFALIEGARSNAIRLESECVMDIGMNSILAEYHRELLAQYNLFAVDSSYGTDVTGSTNVAEHLQAYVSRNLSMEDVFLEELLYRDFLGMSVKGIEVTGVSILTDNEGAIFRKRAVEAVKDDVGLTGLTELMKWTETVKDNALLTGDAEEEKCQKDAEIEKYNGTQIPISETEWTTVVVDNPTKNIVGVVDAGIFQIFLEEQELSDKVLQTETLISERRRRNEVSVGNLRAENTADDLAQLEERFLFQEYLLRYLGSYRNPKEAGALSYQVEYLLFGEQEDAKNFKRVVTTLCALRQMADFVSLNADAEKRKEAEAVASTVTYYTGIPQLTPLVQTTLLLAWSIVEGISDVQIILAGGRVPLLKSNDDWNYSLAEVLQWNGNTLQNDISRVESKNWNIGDGLSYEDYFRIFMMMSDEKELTERAMNMVEADIRLMPGNGNFRLDACYDCLEAQVIIESSYGYCVEITRIKGYE